MKINIRQYRCLLTSNNKILNRKGEEENAKDQVFMKRGYRETLEFFNNLNVRSGEELLLQQYVDNGWVTRNKKSMGRGAQEVTL